MRLWGSALHGWDSLHRLSRGQNRRAGTRQLPCGHSSVCAVVFPAFWMQGAQLGQTYITCIWLQLDGAAARDQAC